MSNFEPSPRSSKRRKITTYGADSAKSKASLSNPRSISKSATSISRRLFERRDNEVELTQGNWSKDVQDSAYGSKEDSFVVEGTADGFILQSVGERASESADELAQSEVTIMPIKAPKTGLQHKEQLPKTAEKGLQPRGADRKAGRKPVETRSSGRDRKRPRRFSGSWEDRSRPESPKRSLIPSRKGNRGRQKSVALKQDGSWVEEDLGFKDIDESTNKKAQSVKQRKESHHGDEAQGKANRNAHQIHRRTVSCDNLSESRVEDEPLPEIPELVNLVAVPSADFSLEPADSHLDAAKSLVLSRLTGEILTPLTVLEAEYSKLHSLLSATIKEGEGNSILILGSRGAGKTCLVETAIAELAIEFAQEFHVVRLNGFLQTDDKLALREIWRQLGREMQVREDETAQVNTYADTMASLLHLLSHPEELAESLEPNAVTSTAKSVVFILDEFDLFATHPRQTLLYNLFDIAQARKAPIAVIGCSARVDVSDILEKRVKSRFSHRWIHLPQAKNFPAFEEIAKAALMLREHDKYHKRQSISLKVRTGWNAFIEVCWDLIEQSRRLKTDLGV